MRKTNCQSKWDKLTEAQQAELWDWLERDNLGYIEVIARARTRWGISSSATALSNWRSRYAQRALLDRISASAARANTVMAQFSANPANTYDALLQLIGQTAFEAQLAGGEKLDLSTLKDLAELTALGLKARYDSAILEHKNADLTLKRERYQRETCELFLQWAEDKRAQSIAAGSISNSDKIEQLGQLMFPDTWK